MSFLIGVQELEGALVHHTGTMVRFRPAQLDYLPTVDSDCAVTLLDGKTVTGRFRRHPANPYIGGRELVRWIKTWIHWNAPMLVTVEQVGPGMQVRLRTRSGGYLETTEGKKVRREAIRLAKVKDVARRRRGYTSWERDPALRQLVLRAWESKCQVVGCLSHNELPEALADRILDVHHIEFVSSGGSDSPTNLCLLCASHHVLLHRAPSMRVIFNNSEETQIAVNGLNLTIKRNVSDLWSQIDV